MKYLINTKTEKIVKEAKSIGQNWVDSQFDYEFLELNDAVLPDGSYRTLTNVELYPLQMKRWKGQRQKLVDSIEVVYNDVTYQGDETSQDRMSRSINGMDDTDTIDWKAKDNSTVTLTKADLRAILKLAGQEQTRIWFENEPVLGE